MIDFEITEKEGRARKGMMRVNEKETETPFFMPVATRGSVRTLSNEEAHEIGFDVLIANAYHLLLKPGSDVIKDAGGIHRYINWPGIIFTDSGGFQMIRTGFDQDIMEEGVRFRSEVDGSTIKMTPEENIELQIDLGADVSMCLDHCPPYPAERDLLVKSVELTTRWAERCKRMGHDTFCISQGGIVDELRTRSCKELVDIGFQGYAIGGLSIGEPKEDMYRMVDICDKVYPADRPRYLMGLGSPLDILESVERGVDIFDSAYPTRNARHGTIMTREGKISIDKGRYRKDHGPLDDSCGCPVCENYSRSFVSHLSRSRELSALRFATIHNLWFMNELMEDAKIAIANGSLRELKSEFKRHYG